MTEKITKRQIPFLRPTPPRLSEHIDELRALEQSGQYSNFGPVNTRFEQEIRQKLFHNTGAVTSVANATLGLMLAIKAVTGDEIGRRYALTQDVSSRTISLPLSEAMSHDDVDYVCDVALRNVPDGVVVVGNPAKALEE